MSITILSRCIRQQLFVGRATPFIPSNAFHGTYRRLDIVQKYLDKVQKRAEEKGVSIDELKETVKKAAARPVPLPEAQKLRENAEKNGRDPRLEARKAGTIKHAERRDNSPVKPLAEIMDIHKVFRKPHTSEQVAALWTAFHASRSGGTGRGYLSAAVPLQTYKSLVETGRKYPSFIMPLLRAQEDLTGEGSEQKEPTYEFFYMQWSFHAAPPVPTPTILEAPLPEGVLPPPPDLPLATVLFTPLLEYKTRTTFATPHLVLTLYPDLAHSHELVLLRGELTASPSGGGRFLMSQQDAQLLALGVQRFYLASGDIGEGQERAELLSAFNEKPSEFRWEKLLRHANPTL